MSIKVSVVIPVYNPGHYLDRCLRSLRDQTMPMPSWEAVFVDDGSDDGTAERLDRLAVEHPTVRVIHIPHSGSAGRPRNAGIEAAQGEYVQFLDQDDALGPEALDRLYELGRRGSADIVIGKVASNFANVPHALFATTRERCTLLDAPLVESLTPHKMFRTQFLREQRLGYVDDLPQLADQMFVLRTYFAARGVAVLGRYACYFHLRRGDGRNAGSARIDPARYYQDLRRLLDVVEAETEPGKLRNSLLQRFYRVEVLGRLNDRTLLHSDPAFAEQVFSEVHKLAVERISEQVHAGLPGLLRVRSSLVRADRYDALLELARRCEAITARTHLDAAGWQRGRLRLRLRAELARGQDGPALGLVRRGGRYFLDDGLIDGLVDPAEAEVTDELSRLRVAVVARGRQSAGEWPVPAELEMRLDEGERTGSGVRCSMLFSGTATLDPQRLAGRRPLPRDLWDLWVRLNMLGVNRRTRLGPRRSPEVDDRPAPAVLGKTPQVVVPFFTDAHASLSLDVDRRSRSLGAALAGRTARPEPGNGQRVELRLDAASAPGTTARAAALVLRSDRADGVVSGPEAVLPARLEAVGWKLRLVADVGRGPFGPVARLAPGHWQLAARLDEVAGSDAGARTGSRGARAGEEGTAVELGTGEVDQRGRLFVDGAPRVGPATELTRRVARAAVSRPRVRRIGIRVVDRLPDPWRLWIRGVVRRAGR